MCPTAVPRVWRKLARPHMRVHSTACSVYRCLQSHTEFQLNLHARASIVCWQVVRENTAWLASNGTEQQPFFMYQGLNIVHPDYDTSEEYISRIDQSKIEVRFSSRASRACTVHVIAHWCGAAHRARSIMRSIGHRVHSPTTLALIPSDVMFDVCCRFRSGLPSKRFTRATTRRRSRKGSEAKRILILMPLLYLNDYLHVCKPRRHLAAE